jgi:hypothetical protein
MFAVVVGVTFAVNVTGFAVVNGAVEVVIVTPSGARGVITTLVEAVHTTLKLSVTPAVTVYVPCIVNGWVELADRTAPRF